MQVRLNHDHPGSFVKVYIANGFLRFDKRYINIDDSYYKFLKDNKSLDIIDAPNENEAKNNTNNEIKNKEQNKEEKPQEQSKTINKEDIKVKTNVPFLNKKSKQKNKGDK